ncbi:hypothetical protein ACO2Q1_08360 [Brevundimonas sp. VNH65]|uniref:hypothetical protein n=1 Tax=Brevundimonas sp. VNH65 TaxID=3400917 RepID=UPI003BFF8841
MTGGRGENSPNIGFFSLRTQFENVGDALINRELIRLMAGEGPTHVDLSRCPPEFRRTLALQDIPNVRIAANSKELFWKLLLEAWAGRRPFYFLSPGGYTGDVTGFLKRGANLVALAMLRMLGVRLVQVGTSYDNLSTRHAWLLRMRSKLLWAHHVRDSESLGYGRSLGMNVHGVMPDLAFNIFDQDTGDRAMTGKAAICFRSDQYPDQLAEVEQIVTRHLIQSFSSLVIVVQVDRDIVGATKLKSSLAQLGYRQVEIEVCAHDLKACAAIDVTPVSHPAITRVRR